MTLSAGALDRTNSQPTYLPNRAPDTHTANCGLHFPSRVIISRRMAEANEAHDTAPRAASLPPVDDWYWRDLEEGGGLPDEAEPPLLPRSCASARRRTPNEILLSNRTISEEGRNVRARSLGSELKEWRGGAATHG